MDVKEYKIRKALIFPLGLNLLLGSALLALSVVQKQPTAKLIILLAILLVLGLFFVETLFRRIRLDTNAIIQHKFFQKKTLLFADITAFDSMSLRKRVFSTLSSEERFLIFTNAYANYPELVLAILNRLPENRVSPETRKLASSPPVRYGDVISFWVMAIVFAGILLHQASLYFQ